MDWHKVPEFETVSSSDDNPFAGSRVQPTGKVSVKLPVDDWLCRKMEKLNLTIREGYPARNTETAGLLKGQFIKPPDQLLTKAEEEISRSEERRPSGQSHRRQGRFHPYGPSDKHAHQPDQKSGTPAWKQIRDRQQAKKRRVKPSTFFQKPAKGAKPRK